MEVVNQQIEQDIEKDDDDNKEWRSLDLDLSPPALDMLVNQVRVDEYNGDVVFSYCKALAAVLKDVCSRPEFKLEDMIDFGTKKMFGSAGHMRDHFYEMARKLFELDPVSVKYNFGIAALCSSGLPYWARNQQFAKLCLRRALVFHHDMPKALTRMGFFILNTEKNVAEARQYFENARLLADNDFVAVTAFLYCLFADFEEWKDEVPDLLKEELRKSCWTDEQTAQLYFIRGLMQMNFQGYQRSVAASWILALDKSEATLRSCFTTLERTKLTYRFPLNVDKVYSLVNFNNILRKSGQYVDVDSEKLNTLRSIIKEIGRKELKEQQQRKKKEMATKLTLEKGCQQIPGKRWRKDDNDWLDRTLGLHAASDEEKEEALKLLGISQGKVSVHQVDAAYRKFGRKLHSMRENDPEKARLQTFEYNRAYAILRRHYEKMANEEAKEPDDDLESILNSLSESLALDGRAITVTV